MVRAAPIVALVLAACEHPMIEDAVHIDGVHVDVEYDPELPICAASVERADRFVVAVAELFDTAVPDITVHLYENATGCEPVAGHATDCASDREVWAISWIQYHELVHAVTYELGAPPAFLREGLAEALGNATELLGAGERRTAAVPVDSVDFYAGHPEAAYRAARDFSVYLMARFGVPAYRELYRSLLGLADPVTVRATFARVLDARLDDVIAAWRSWIPDAEATSGLPLSRLACDAPVVAPDPADRWMLDEPGCVDTLRFAQRDERRVELATPGLYALTARVAPVEAQDRSSVTVELADCQAVEPDARVSLSGTDTAHTDVAWIDAGARVLAQHQYGSALARATSIELEGIGDASATCPAAPAFAAPASWSLRYARAPSDWPGTGTDPELGAVRAAWIRVDLPPGTPPSVIAGVTGPASLRLCQGSCGAPTNCIVIRPEDDLVTWQPLASSPIWIRAYAVSGAGPVVFAMTTD